LKHFLYVNNYKYGDSAKLRHKFEVIRTCNVIMYRNGSLNCTIIAWWFLLPSPYRMKHLKASGRRDVFLELICCTATLLYFNNTWCRLEGRWWRLVKRWIKENETKRQDNEDPRKRQRMNGLKEKREKKSILKQVKQSQNILLKEWIKNRYKDSVHTSSYTINLDYVTFETKSTVAQ
jgi:hypothetical protein